MDDLFLFLVYAFAITSAFILGCVFERFVIWAEGKELSPLTNRVLEEYLEEKEAMK